MSRRKRLPHGGPCPSPIFNVPSREVLLGRIGEHLRVGGVARVDTRTADLAGLGVHTVLERFPEAEALHHPSDCFGVSQMQFAPKLRW